MQQQNYRNTQAIFATLVAIIARLKIVKSRITMAKADDKKPKASATKNKAPAKHKPASTKPKAPKLKQALQSLTTMNLHSGHTKQCFLIQHSKHLSKQFARLTHIFNFLGGFDFDLPKLHRSSP
ncbi:hypothetical protein [Marinicellulosiphila megalodicopiae]|uniref:hypothetical protein n=1 Tax=Marinicellulosiphila megalodicopiae TaxID=2724896 RepID=UPI003BAE6C26